VDQTTPSEPGDEMFAEPYVDVDEWRDSPDRHRYVHGGFAGTETRFSIYLPPERAYEGRFFQHITPVPDSEHLAQRVSGEQDKIGFSISSGGYFLETNGGGASGSPGSSVDPTIAAYRANAAAAQYSRAVAAAMYGQHRAYGYAYGGSGGGYRTIGGAENTTGVWDGVVPYVIGSPMAIPNMFTVRMHALRILRDRLDGIVDAVEPGGSGDMYEHLNEEERDALTEVTDGVPSALVVRAPHHGHARLSRPLSGAGDGGSDLLRGILDPARLSRLRGATLTGARSGVASLRDRGDDLLG
jgi:hypothetical protein